MDITLSTLRTSILTCLFSLAFLSLGSVVLAADGSATGAYDGSATGPTPVSTCATGNCTLQSPFTASDFPSLINKLLDIIIKIGGILAFFFIIYAGFMFVTAGGDETKISSAKTMFVSVIIGTAIVLGSKAILQLLTNTSNGIIN